MFVFKIRHPVTSAYLCVLIAGDSDRNSFSIRLNAAPFLHQCPSTQSSEITFFISLFRCEQTVCYRGSRYKNLLDNRKSINSNYALFFTVKLISIILLRDSHPCSFCSLPSPAAGLTPPCEEEEGRGGL